MSVVTRILSFCVVLPFILTYAILLGGYFLLLLLYTFISSPFDFLLDFVHDEGKDVKHATQAIIYLIGFPLIFVFKLLLSFITLILFIIHFITSLIGYIATLGGIHFYPLLINQGERFEEAGPKKFKKKVTFFFVTFGLILCILAIFFKPVYYKIYEGMYDDGQEFNNFVYSVREEYEAGNISEQDYYQFIEKINHYEIDVDNYRNYYKIYLGKPYVWNEKYMDPTYSNTANTLSNIFVSSYVLFVCIYIPVAFKMKKQDKEVNQEIPVLEKN